MGMKRLILLAVAVAPMLWANGSEARDLPPGEKPPPLAMCASSVDEFGHYSGVTCWDFMVVPGLASD